EVRECVVGGRSGDETPYGSRCQECCNDPIKRPRFRFRPPEITADAGAQILWVARGPCAAWVVAEIRGDGRSGYSTCRARGRLARWYKLRLISTVLSGCIEVQRRRVAKDGRVKLRLPLLGTAVDRCGICMTQFWKAESGRLSEGCRHAFYERCLGRWVARNRTRPRCSIPDIWITYDELPVVLSQIHVR
ncbi:hypothetical protein C8J57DRAFT_181852, partial [Mycena rebaudengoi]